MADVVNGELQELLKKIYSLVGRLQPEDSPGHGEWKALEPEWTKLQDEIRAWDSKDEDGEEKVRKRLLSLHSMLIRAVELDGPLDENNIMHYKHAPNWSVVGVTVLAAICTVVVLVWIYMLWPEATGQAGPPPAGQTSEGAKTYAPNPEKPKVPDKSAPAVHQGSEPKSPTPSDQPITTPKQDMEMGVSIRTDKGVYRSGDRPRIGGHMFLGTGNPASGLARIEIFEIRPDKDEQLPPKLIERYNNVVEVKAGEFVDDGFVINIQEKHPWLSAVKARYRAMVIGLSSSVNSPMMPFAFIEFSVLDVGWAIIVFYVLLALVILFSGLIWVYFSFMRRGTKSAAKNMLLMTYAMALLFLALPFLVPSVILLFPDLEGLLRSSPVGFLKAPLGHQNEIQWVMNLGGVFTSSGELKGGIAAPLLVFVLSLVGASINMLRQLPDFLKKYDAIPEDLSNPTGKMDERNEAAELREDLSKYFVYILSAPFIAMVAYALMMMADYTNPHALAIVAFSVGFISDTVVESVMGKAKELLAGKKEGGEKADTEKEEAETGAKKDEPEAGGGKDGSRIEVAKDEPIAEAGTSETNAMVRNAEEKMGVPPAGTGINVASK